MSVQGDHYEQQACEFLAGQGLRLIDRNFRAKTGEVDIIARDGDALVFIEVRARSNPRFTGAAASVDQRKRLRLLRTAQYYLQRHPRLATLPCRFDVVAFEPPQSGTELCIQWIQSAFTA